MNNLNTNNEYPGCKYRFPWIQIMILSIVACCVCVAEQIQGKHTISLCSNLWEPGLSARVFYQTIFKDFFHSKDCFISCLKNEYLKMSNCFVCFNSTSAVDSAKFLTQPFKLLRKKTKTRKENSSIHLFHCRGVVLQHFDLPGCHSFDNRLLSPCLSQVFQICPLGWHLKIVLYQGLILFNKL